jgi:hypothetical protein
MSSNKDFFPVNKTAEQVFDARSGLSRPIQLSLNCSRQGVRVFGMSP